jgi:hypothetical protein
MAKPYLQSLRESLEMVEEWRQAHGGTYNDRVNLSHLGDMEGLVKQFGVDRLKKLALRKHRALVTINAKGFDATVEINRLGGFVPEKKSGEPGNVFSGTQLKDIEDAFEDKRGEDVLRLCGDLQCTTEVTIEIEPKASGFNWIRTSAALTNAGVPGGWWDTMQVLFRPPPVARLVVGDAGAEWLTAGGLAISGPDAKARPPSGYVDAPWQAYRKAWLNDDRQTLPPPVAIFPSVNDGLSSVQEFLGRAAHALCWIWLATSAEVSATKCAITFERGAFLEVPLNDLPTSQGVEDAIALSEWSCASTDPIRRDAVEQAISLAVSNRDALFGSARRVLNTAKRLLQLAQSGAIAEALASRRAAIQAAVDAARASSDAARGAARNSSDRVFAEVAAGVGIILTNYGALISVVAAHYLIIVVGALAAVTGISAYAFEYPSAAHTLQSYETDLGARSDALTEDDVKQIKDMRTLKQARDDLTGAKINTAILLAGAGLVLVIGWLVVK